ncbi:uncharacterized protein PV09_09864, partial [Verruconis gallopava]
MATRSRHLPDHKKRPVLMPKDEGNGKPPTRPRSSRIAKRSAINKVAIYQTGNKQQEAAAERSSLRESLHTQTTNPVQKPATRKRPVEPDVEQGTEHRRKRSRKSDRQLLAQQPNKKRQRDTLDPIHNKLVAAPRKRVQRFSEDT